MENEKTIIEINGVKLEVDLRNAKKIENFKVGDGVKVLTKNYSGYKSHVGTIVGFDQFENLPTIIVAYLEVEYDTAKVLFAYINAESKEVEICALNEWDLPYTKSDIITKMDREVLKKEEELRELKSKKQYFLHAFGKYFEQHLNK